MLKMGCHCRPICKVVLQPGWLLAPGWLLVLVTAGCSAAPAQNIMGSFFPAWLLCAAIGRFIDERVLAPAQGSSLPAPASQRAAVPLLLGGDFNSLPIKTESDAFDVGETPWEGQTVGFRT